MTDGKRQTGRELATRLGLKVQHALYRETGDWYHELKSFPGELIDADGYVVFENQREFRDCRQLQVKERVHVPKGIKAIPCYVWARPNHGLQKDGRPLTGKEAQNRRE